LRDSEEAQLRLGFCVDRLIHCPKWRQATAA
jgi:hypothetical protein